MRCVSYTRFTSNRTNDRKYADAIAQQNQMIEDYAKSHGFKVSKKYSDRKDDPKEDAAFLQLKQDGMERQFDCLIIASFSRFGNSSYEAYKLLEHVFVPMGIRFIVVDEDFDSAAQDPETVHTFLVGKRRAPVKEKEKREKNVFGSRILDMGNGKTLYAKRDAETDRVFFEHSSGPIELNRIYMKACQRMEQEKADALKAVEWLKSEEGKRQKTRAGSKTRNRADAAIKEILDVENERIEQARLLKKNLISREVYEKRMAELESSVPELDASLEELVLQLETVDRDYSEKNPWIKLYTKIELMPLERADWFVINRRIGKVRIYDAGNMEFELLSQEYRDMFPPYVFDSIDGIKEETDVKELSVTSATGIDPTGSFLTKAGSEE